MKIINFEEKYRDDMIYMVLSAKNALGRVPRLNEDLLDIYEKSIEEIDTQLPDISQNKKEA